MLEKKAIATLIISIASFLSGFLELSMASEVTNPSYPHEMSYYVDKYNFTKSEIKSEMKRVEKENLKYFIDNIVPFIPPEYDAQLVFWWAYIEGAVSENRFPWRFSNCTYNEMDLKDHELKKKYNLRPDTDCILHYKGKLPPSGKWQVGYGIQVSDNIRSLRRIFNVTHAGQTEKLIGDIVLDKAGQTSFRFPEKLSVDLIAHNPTNYTSTKSNAYWASVLMRDPIVSAYIIAELCDKRTDMCACFGKHKGDEVSMPRWCGSGTSYSKDNKIHSMMMKKLINTWSELTKSTTP